MSSNELWVVSWLLDVSIKAALLAAAVWLAVAVCRVQSSTVRHRVWLLVAGGMLLLPGLVNVVPGVPLPDWLYPTLQLAAVTGEADGGTPSRGMQAPAADGMNARSQSGSRSALPFGELAPVADGRDAATRGLVGQ
jgi:hypothetical protein